MLQHEATAPEALAKALTLLAHVSVKRLESCTFSGGVDCAWLAAFAEFILGLSIDITNSKAGYSYRSDNKVRDFNNEAQITILQGPASTADIMLTKKSFCLPSGKAILPDLVAGPPVSQFCTRSPWTTILRDAFGTEIENLLSEPTRQSVARFLVMEAWKTENGLEGLPSSAAGCWEKTFRYNLQDCSRNPSSLGMLRFIAQRLPELQPCLEAIQPWSSLEEFEEQLHIDRKLWRAACKNRGCTCKETSILPSFQRERAERAMCGENILSALVVYTEILYRVQVHQDVLPTPDGLRQLSLVNPLRLNSHAGLLSGVLMLFTSAGNRHRFRPSSPHAFPERDFLALASEGVCCWYGLLADVKGPPASACKIYVAPGYIEHEGSTYKKIQDLDLAKGSWLKHPFSSHTTFELLIQETQSEELRAAYKTQVTRSKMPWAFQISAVINAIMDEMVGQFEPEQHLAEFSFHDTFSYDRYIRDSQASPEVKVPPDRTLECEIVRDSFVLVLLIGIALS